MTLFLMLAKDAGNWSGMPLFNGNVTLLGEREDRGLLTNLKRAGLVKTTVDEGCTWVLFTDAGIALATENRIHLGLDRDNAGQDALLAELQAAKS